MLKAIAVYGSLSVLGASLVLLSAANLWLKVKFQIMDENYTKIGGKSDE